MIGDPFHLMIPALPGTPYTRAALFLDEVGDSIIMSKLVSTMLLGIELTTLKMTRRVKHQEISLQTLKVLDSIHSEAVNLRLTDAENPALFHQLVQDASHRLATINQPELTIDNDTAGRLATTIKRSAQHPHVILRLATGIGLSISAPLSLPRAAQNTVLEELRAITPAGIHTFGNTNQEGQDWYYWTPSILRNHPSTQAAISSMKSTLDKEYSDHPSIVVYSPTVSV